MDPLLFSLFFAVHSTPCRSGSDDFSSPSCVFAFWFFCECFITTRSYYSTIDVIVDDRFPPQSISDGDEVPFRETLSLSSWSKAIDVLFRCRYRFSADFYPADYSSYWLINRLRSLSTSLFPSASTLVPLTVLGLIETLVICCQSLMFFPITVAKDSHYSSFVIPVKVFDEIPTYIHHFNRSCDEQSFSHLPVPSYRPCHYCYWQRFLG